MWHPLARSTTGLLPLESVNGIQLSRPPRRPKSEGHSDETREDKRSEHCRQGNGGAPSRNQGNQQGGSGPCKNTENSPKTPIAADSTKNCRRMSPGVAPMALRSPISRVRSVTETSMMFMMPIPPTNREIPAMTSRRRESVLLVSVSADWMSAMLKMRKASSVWDGGMSWMERRTESILD